MKTTPSSLRISLWWTCLAFFALILTPLNLFSATFTSIADGNWSSSSTWLGGSVPGSSIAAADTVNIFHIVTYNLPNDLEILGTVNIVNGTFRTALTGNGMNRSVFIKAGGEWNMCNSQMFLPIFSCGYGCDTGGNLAGNFRNEGGTITIFNSTVEVAQNWEDVSPAGAGIRSFIGGCLKIGENFTNKGAIDLYDDTCIELGHHGSGNWENEYRQTFQNSTTLKLVGSGSVSNSSSVPNGVLGGPGSPDILALEVTDGNLNNNGPWTAQVLNFCIDGGSVAGSQAADFNDDVTNNDTPAACAAVDTVNCFCPLGVCMLEVTASVVMEISCDPGNDGSVTVSITPGSETPFCGNDTITYLWNTMPPQTNDTITGLPPGTYTVTVTDASGCTDTASVTLNAPMACCTLVVVCPPENGGVFDCPDDVPAPDTNLVIVLDSCGLITTTVEDDTTGTGCGTDTMFIVRSYFITDGVNFDTCEQTFKVVDDEAPGILCPANVTIDCTDNTSPDSTGTATPIDNCDTSVMIVQIDTIIPGNCPQEYMIIRTWTATDDCGNSGTCVQTITVEDNTPPSITCPANVTVECAGDVPAADTGSVMSSDNCDGMPTVTHEGDAVVNMTCINRFMVARTYRATDDCGNSSTCVQTITVFDDTAPVITCPADTIVECASDVPAPDTASVTASDNCGGIPTVSHVGDVISNMTCANRFIVERTYSATDECGNSATCVQTITVFDDTAPMITCPANITIDCTAGTLPGTTGTATATDNCSGVVTVDFSDESPGGLCPITFNRTWTATDVCGNTAQCVQTITIDDDVPPTITCPADLTIECTDSTAPANTGTATASDNCTASPLVVPSDITTAGGCPQEYTISRTWTASDICGNSATCVQTITVIDTIAPSIICPVDVTVDCASDVPVFDPVNVTTSDNCDSTPSVTSGGDVISNMTCVNRFTMTRTYIATDDCGNSASCTQVITVNDITPPDITCPADITVNSGEDTSPMNTGSASATDNCGGMPMVTSADITIAGACPDDYSIQRTWTATDECDNSSTCVQFIDVNGSCNVDLALVKDLDPGQGAIAGGDNVNFTITVTNEGDVAVGSITIVDYIPDGFILNDPDWTPGMEGSTGQSASIVLSSANGGLDMDGLQPAESVMVQITLQAEPDITSGIYENIAEISMVLDTLGNDVTNADVDSDADTDDTNDPAEEDDHDPASICVLAVPVILGPEFVCSGDTSLYTLSNYNPANTYMWALSGGGIIIENNDSSIVIHWTAAPGGPFMITVTEISGPDCQTMGSLDVFIQGGEAIACLDHVNLSIDDECGTVVTSGMILTGDQTGNNNYTVYVIDMNGDTVPNATLTWMHVGQTFKVSVVSICSGQSCWGFLTVEDKLPPQINCVCPVGNEGDSCQISCLQINEFLNGEIPEEVQPTVVDNCGGTTIEIVNIVLNFETCSGGYIRVTWLATDIAGNTSTCEQEFIIVPLTLETLRFPPDYFGDCDDSSDPSVTGWPQVDGLDLSNIPSHCNILATYTDNEFDLCGGGRKIIRSWKVFDWCVPEVREFVQFIILADQEGPVLTCPDDLTVGTDVWFCYANVLVPKPVAIDACSGIKQFHLFSPEGTVVAAGNNFIITGLPLGTHTVTWTVYDDCHNSSSCSFDITVIDNVPPVMACQAHTVVSLTNDRPNGITLVPADAFDDGSFDNCSPVSFRARRMDSCIDMDWTTNGACEDDIPDGFITGKDFGTDFGICVPFACCDVGSGPVMVVLEVMDASGNFNICMVEVIVQDKLAPVITCPPDISVSCEFELDFVEGLFTDESGNNDGSLDEDPLSEIFGNMFDAFRHDESVRESIIINDPDNDQLIQPFNWGIDGWATDNCEVSLSVEVTEFDDCSGESLPGDPPPGAVKLITRRFLAVDASGNPSPGTCMQRIWVIDFDPFFITDETCFNENPFDGVIWPCDVLLNECPEELTGTGEPQIFDDHCNIIGISFDDDRFDFADGSCYKILREWTVIDWCQFDINTGAGIWSYTQTIKVLDSAGPEMLECPQGLIALCLDDPGVTLPANNQSLLGENDPDASSCSVHLTMSQSVRELCSESVIYDVKLYPFNGNEFIQLKPSTVLQLDADHEGDMTFNTQQSSMQSISEDGLPYNSPFCDDFHRLVWTVTDGCGNVSICDHLLRLEDCKDPTPVCLNGISSMIMPETGEVTIWASDFNASSFDDCTPANALLYSFSGTAYEPSFTYTCDNVPEFGVPIEEEIWVADEGVDQNCNGVIEWSERNKDFCITYIIITDENNVCGQQQGVVLIGEIMTEHTDAISQATVKLSGPGGSLPEFITSTDGKFTFSNVLAGQDYTIKPERNDDHRNGVSTLDLVGIQKHLLGKELFTSPYQFIAADANSSSSVSAVDLIEIRKLILGLYSTYPLNKSWRFVKEGSFMEPDHPWPFEETIEIQDLSGNEMNNLDFVGVKIGDVNNTAKANAQQIIPRDGRKVMKVNAVSEDAIRSGDIIEVRFVIPELISGFQWTLETNGLEYISVRSKDIMIDESNIGLPEKGIVTMSWNGEPINDGSVKEKLSFIMAFKVVEPGVIYEKLLLTSAVTAAEAYSPENEIMDVKLSFDNSALFSNFALYQNQPNPWSGYTVVGFDLPEEAVATLTVYDVAGKIVKTVTGQYKQGYNSIVLNDRELPGAGILYYHLKSGGYSATKKMIIVR